MSNLPDSVDGLEMVNKVSMPARRNSNPIIKKEELKLDQSDQSNIRPITAELQNENVVPDSFHPDDQNTANPKAPRNPVVDDYPLDLNDSHT